jgi:hypothetical protein
MVSGFPAIQSLDQIESEIVERRRYYTETVKVALEGFELTKLVDVVTRVVETTTDAGETHAPLLVHDLVDRYEANANRFLEPEAVNIQRLIEAIRDAAQQGEAAVKPLIQRMDQLARNWDVIAQEHARVGG